MNTIVCCCLTDHNSQVDGSIYNTKLLTCELNRSLISDVQTLCLLMNYIRTNCLMYCTVYPGGSIWYSSMILTNSFNGQRNKPWIIKFECFPTNNLWLDHVAPYTIRVWVPMVWIDKDFSLCKISAQEQHQFMSVLEKNML